jgi:iron complex transport system substrate-binding protein
MKETFRIRSVKKLIRILVPALLMILTVLINSCNGDRTVRNSGSESRLNGNIIYAERLKIEKYEGYSKVTITNPWQGAENVNQVFYLTNRGSVIPGINDSASVITVPVGKIICMSTTHIAMISALGEENSIYGMSGAGYIYSENLLTRVRKGLLPDVGFDFNLDKEMILKISPDLIIMYGVGSESEGYVGRIKDLGIRILYDADYLETHPLGKAEWIKLFGALFCRENLADSLFESESEAYSQIRSMISGSSRYSPKVLLGLPFKDTWFISPGNTFISKLIDDAGGSYLWKDLQSSYSMPFGIENVYMKAMYADYWLNIGDVTTREEIMMIDPRLKELPCYRRGHLYNNNKRVTNEGGNDYWETGAVKPHLILKDIGSILHPEIFAGSDLYFYRRID